MLFSTLKRAGRYFNLHIIFNLGKLYFIPMKYRSYVFLLLNFKNVQIDFLNLLECIN